LYIARYRPPLWPWSSGTRRVSPLHRSHPRITGFPLPPGEHIIRLSVADMILAPGRYFVDVGLDPVVGAARACDVIYDYPLLSVLDNEPRRCQWLDRPWGSVYCQTVQWNLDHYNQGRRVGPEPVYSRGDANG
jgi:hypothetical protein